MYALPHIFTHVYAGRKTTKIFATGLFTQCSGNKQKKIPKKHATLGSRKYKPSFVRCVGERQLSHHPPPPLAHNLPRPGQSKEPKSICIHPRLQLLLSAFHSPVSDLARLTRDIHAHQEAHGWILGRLGYQFKPNTAAFSPWSLSQKAVRAGSPREAGALPHADRPRRPFAPSDPNSVESR